MYYFHLKFHTKCQTKKKTNGKWSEWDDDYTISNPATKAQSIATSYDSHTICMCSQAMLQPMCRAFWWIEGCSFRLGSSLSFTYFSCLIEHVIIILKEQNALQIKLCNQRYCGRIRQYYYLVYRCGTLSSTPSNAWTQLIRTFWSFIR